MILVSGLSLLEFLSKKRYLVSIQQWWNSVQAKAAAISQPQA
jgi:hypothetical protein